MFVGTTQPLVVERGKKKEKSVGIGVSRKKAILVTHFGTCHGDGVVCLFVCFCFWQVRTECRPLAVNARANGGHLASRDIVDNHIEIAACCKRAFVFLSCRSIHRARATKDTARKCRKIPIARQMPVGLRANDTVAHALWKATHCRNGRY